MKKIVSVLSMALVLVAISSCDKTKDKVNEATEFDINYGTSLTIPSTSISATAPADFTTPEINTESSSKFSAEKTTKDLVDEIKMTKFTISNPSGNLDYLKSISIYLKTSGMGDVLVATKDNIPAGTSSTNADLKDVNIKDYIFKDKIQFRVTVTVSTGLSGNQQLKMDQTMHVKGKRIS